MVTIIDYGLGNLRSVQKAFEFIGRKAVLTSDRKKIEKSSLVVLPGVGSFSAAMKNLKKLNLTEVIKRVIADGKPYLGLCLGLQLLFEKSEEGNCRGLGILKGEVKKFPSIKGLKIPHMGWNSVRWEMARLAQARAERGDGRVSSPAAKRWEIFKGIKNDSYFYFVHSYYVRPKDKNIITSTTDYGIVFASSVFHKNIFATQFHPEKSQKNGMELLKNYVNYTCN